MVVVRRPAGCFSSYANSDIATASGTNPTANAYQDGFRCGGGTRRHSHRDIARSRQRSHQHTRQHGEQEAERPDATRQPAAVTATSPPAATARRRRRPDAVTRGHRATTSRCAMLLREHSPYCHPPGVPSTPPAPSPVAAPHATEGEGLPDADKSRCAPPEHRKYAVMDCRDLAGDHARCCRHARRQPATRSRRHKRAPPRERYSRHDPLFAATASRHD